MALSRKNTPRCPVFDDETKGPDLDLWFAPLIDGSPRGHGLVPRDLATYPPQMFDPPSGLALIPRSEWDARLDEQEREKSSLEHVRGEIPSLDQNGQGFCWAYSTGSALTLVAALNNRPYVRLSPHAVACKIKNFRDEGGWCGLSAKFARETGFPDVTVWPEKSMSRSSDTAATWANAARRKVTEDFADLTRDVYDQNLTFDQVATCLLAGIPCMTDFNHWSHSVCAIRLVRVEAGSYGLKIWNSWADAWGERGMGILRGSKAIPDGAVAIRVAGG